MNISFSLLLESFILVEALRRKKKESLKLFKNSIVSPEDFSYILILTGMGCPCVYSRSCFQVKIRYFPANFQDECLNLRLSEKVFVFYLLS